jgi:hypothetical protein
MSERSADDTRKLLKVFGVAVTTFEERSGTILGGMESDGGAAEGQAAAVREMLELVVDTTRKWQQVTDHLLSAQLDALERLAGSLRTGSR